MEELFVQDPAVSTAKTKKDPPETRKKEMRKEAENKDEKTGRTVYSHDEAVTASISYFNGDELAARVWANKYALKDSFGNLFEKTPDDMHRRIAREICRIERATRTRSPRSLSSRY
jgi:ribonucleotide reductase alpha subunit